MGLWSGSRQEGSGMKYDLSVIIPARNEQFLINTINDVLAARRGSTEVIVILDGQWNPHPIESHPDVTIIHHSVSIGQRAAINEAARLSTAKYMMKLDGHCRMDEGFDVKLTADCDYDWIVVPRLYNLHVFDQMCTKCGTRTYQGPKLTHCTACNQDAEHEMVMVWEPRWSRMTDTMRFDSDLHFQYWRDLTKRPGYEGEICDTMSLLGACWFLHRKRYWELDGSDEGHGSWGQQGTEIACKAWLSGGRLIVNKRTWYSHLFRTQPGFGFPYPLSHGQTEAARAYSKKFWREGRWAKAKLPLSAIVSRFWPVPGWTDQDLDDLKRTEAGHKVQLAVVKEIEANPPKYVESAPDTGLTKGIVYFTENKCPEPIFSTVQKQLARSINGHQLVSVSLKPIEFGNNIVLGLKRGYLTMFQQILAGLSLLDTDFAFLCEHDVLYTPEHFAFTPPRKDTYFYNENVWTVSAKTGQTLFRYRHSTSQLVADRRLLIDHYRERIARTEAEGFNYKNGFEPGTRQISHGGYDNFRAQSFFASRPNVDIRDHGSNLTKTVWNRNSFRNIKYTAGWAESDRIPQWHGISLGRFGKWLEDVASGD